MRSQLLQVLESDIKFMVTIGENEINTNQIQIKEMSTRLEVPFKRNEGIQYLIRKFKLS